MAAVSLQGPTACAVLKALALTGIEHLRPFRMARFPLGRFELEVSRTGFTGDLGYELWTRPEAAVDLWDRLLTAGCLHGLRAIGWQPVEIARIEADTAEFLAMYANPLFRLPITFIEMFPIGALVSLASAGLLRNSRFLPARGSPGG